MSWPSTKTVGNTKIKPDLHDKMNCGREESLYDCISSTFYTIIAKLQLVIQPHFTLQLHMNKSYFEFMRIGTKFKKSKCSQQPQVTKKKSFLKSRSPLQIAKCGYVCLDFTIHLKNIYSSLTKYFWMKKNCLEPHSIAEVKHGKC